MTRQEQLVAGRFEGNGAFSDILKDLEWGGFIRRYTMMGCEDICMYHERKV